MDNSGIFNEALLLVCTSVVFGHIDGRNARNRA
jgi:hypothetical protein